MGDLSWFQQARLRAVESLAYWAGRVNASDLMAIFRVSRLIAQRDIKGYLNLAPGNLSYNGTERAYLATSIFKPVLTRGDIEEYLTLGHGASAGVETTYLEHVAMPRFHLRPEVTRIVLTAVRQGCALRLRYRSLDHPTGLDRTLYPHTLVYSGFRWHMRAYCVRRAEFRDFNLARIADLPALVEGKMEAAKPHNDVSWHQNVMIRLAPNPALSTAEQGLIESEFSIFSELKIQSRAALVPYILMAYQVETADTVAKPRKNRLVLVNESELREFIWQ
jgi:predicted DNA-binding transcriptional regulator YafY